MFSRRKTGEELLHVDRVRVQVMDLNPLLAKHLIGKTIPGQIVPFTGITEGTHIVDQEKIEKVLRDPSFRPFNENAKSKFPRNWTNLSQVAKTHPVVILTSSGLIFARNTEKEWKIKHGLANKFLGLFRKPRFYLTELEPNPPGLTKN